MPSPSPNDRVAIAGNMLVHIFVEVNFGNVMFVDKVNDIMDSLCNHGSVIGIRGRGRSRSRLGIWLRLRKRDGVTMAWIALFLPAIRAFVMVGNVMLRHIEPRF